MKYAISNRYANRPKPYTNLLVIERGKFQADIDVRENTEKLVSSTGEVFHYIVEIPYLDKPDVERVLKQLPPDCLLYLKKRCFTVELLGLPVVGSVGARSFGVLIED